MKRKSIPEEDRRLQELKSRCAFWRHWADYESWRQEKWMQ